MPPTATGTPTGAPWALLSNADSSLVIDWSAGMPRVLYWGLPLDRFAPAVTERPVPKASLNDNPNLGLLIEGSSGFGGRPGIEGHRPDGTGWSPTFSVVGEPVVSNASASFQLADEVAGLGLALELELSAPGPLIVRTELTNTGTSPYVVTTLAPSIPVPAHAVDLQTFGGRWCLEFQPDRLPFRGLTVVENRRGRTSHARLPAMFCGTAGFTEQLGEVWGIQLAWSGNFEVTAEAVNDGRRHLQAGVLLAPGEVSLEPGDSFRAPEVIGVYSNAGLSTASQQFHRYVRSFANQPGPDRPRPVLLNTWEAVYFDHDLDTLKGLADVASSVGVERFVLDDGWFGHRRDDTAGLGDWWVSPDVWPDGLGPIVDHVVGLGMEFGLWFEPEMVNPDSDLYREHPEWTLTTDGYEPPLGRNQLVLDVGRLEVRQYLFGRISELLAAYDISYIKWDMNRDVVQGSGADGRAGSWRHVLGLYQLLADLRAAHPDVEIESCSSGGGRADLGILQHTERIWTSDGNDAVDRQAMQRGFSMLLPPEVMGAHIGPPVAHTTARHQPLSFRLATALFGHLGIEWNLLETTTEERNEIKAAIALHKRLRPLLHSGDVVRVDHPEPEVVVHGVVDADRQHAVFAAATVSSIRSTVGAPLRLTGLDADTIYRVSMTDDIASARLFGDQEPGWIADSVDVSGAQLMSSGLQPPVMHPQSVLLLELQAVSAG